MYVLSISEEVLYFVCGLGILQGILLATILYAHPKSDKSVNTALALYILFLSIVMTIPILIRILGWRNTFFVQPFPLLIGPCLYFYLRSFKERITIKKAWPHFVPFILFFFPIYANIAYMSHKYPFGEEINPEILRQPSTLILMYFRLAHLIVYYFLARKQLNSYQKSIRHLFSETTQINLQWVGLLINGYLCLVIAGIIVFPLMTMYPEHVTLLLLIMLSITTPYIYLATLKGVSQPSVWQIQGHLKKEQVEEEFHEAEQLEAEIGSHKEKKTPKTEDRKIEPIVKKILTLMEEEKLYHEAELTLQQLANRLQMPTYLVSQAINEGLQRNFYDLINGYRVEEAKQLLIDPKNQNFTILSIGFEAGFNSKTTFNTVFKKFTGSTPTEYREKMKMRAAVA